MTDTQNKMSKVEQEKLAALDQTLFQGCYVPAFVNLYNEKAATAGVDPITNEDELDKALQLVGFIQQQKQAHANSRPNAINQAFAKVASLSSDTSDKKAEAFAKQAAENPELIAALRQIRDYTG